MARELPAFFDRTFRAGTAVDCAGDRRRPVVPDVAFHAVVRAVRSGSWRGGDRRHTEVRRTRPAVLDRMDAPGPGVRGSWPGCRIVPVRGEGARGSAVVTLCFGTHGWRTRECRT